MPYEPRRRAPRHAAARPARGRRIGPRRRASRRRSASVGVLGAVALSCAAYLAWEFIGTNWRSHAEQRDAITALTSAWGRHTPSTTRAGIAIDGILRIPRFGSAYEVPLVEGTGRDNLALGVGHVVGTAGPGEIGNLALAGHRVTHGEPFRQLPRLHTGDEVIVETATRTFVYRVDVEALRVRDDATWVLAAAPRNPIRAGAGPPHSRRLITLVTCAELFHTDDRLVVFGALIRSYPRVPGHSDT